MNIETKNIDEFSNLGVTVLRKIISDYWLKKIKIGVEKNFKNEMLDKQYIEYYQYGDLNLVKVKKAKDYLQKWESQS